MSVAQNKLVVSRVFAEAFNQGKLDVIDEAVSAAGTDRQHPDEPSFPEHLKQVVTAMRTAFPDLKFEISQMVAEGDWVALHSVMTGTHLGELGRPLLPPDGPPSIAPTGKSIRVPHMHMIRLEDGMGMELWHLMDTTSLMGQLGLLPSRQSSPV